MVDKGPVVGVHMGSGLSLDSQTVSLVEDTGSKVFWLQGAR